MSRCLTICPIGFVEEELLYRIAECTEKACGIASKIASGMENPSYAFDEKRGQYNSKTILKHLLQLPRESLMLMAVTNVDLFVPILKYVYGLAQIRGRCAIISLYRLRPEFYNESNNPDLFMARVEKTALHELGHSLGLTHCRDRRCVMYSSTRIEDTDYKESRFCSTCDVLFAWHLHKCVHDDQT